MSKVIFSLLGARAACLLASCIPQLSFAAFAGIDHRIDEDSGDMWRYHNVPPTALLLASVGGALFLGTKDRLGRTFWKNSEAYTPAQDAAAVFQRTPGRLRPPETGDPNQWRQDGRRFPGGHASGATALVTPLILEYGDDHPAVWLLAALPVYEMAVRMEAGEHWQTDVLAGAALGGVIGYYEHKAGPLTVRLTPGGVFVRFQKPLK